MKYVLFFLLAGVWVARAATAGSPDMESFRAAVKARFLKYTAVNTQSVDGAKSTPSSPGQWELARMLERELREIGLSEVRLDDKCYVYATLPANAEGKKIQPLGFIAHIDTSSAVRGKNVKPVVHLYKGGDVKLPGSPSVVIPESKNPRLARAVGSEIITSDGTALLGADDKAGIAAIMTAMEFLVKNPGIPHGIVRVAFTPDEEVDLSSEGFDVGPWAGTYAYTVDGEQEGEINDETFNAASATVTFTGKNAHPGYAKGIMVNSLYAAASFLASIPEEIKPERTEDRQGYFHPYEVNGNEESTTVRLILRDFELPGLEEKKRRLAGVVGTTRKAFPEVKIDLSVEDGYRNMKSVLATYPHIVEYAMDAMRKVGVEPVMKPIRGGTDGSRLTFKGVPAANIFCGAENVHSLEEWLSVNVLAKAAQAIVEIVRIWGDHPAVP